MGVCAFGMGRNADIAAVRDVPILYLKVGVCIRHGGRCQNDAAVEETKPGMGECASVMSHGEKKYLYAAVKDTPTLRV
eukprot:scaffold167_cov140-Skeletonema_menzelii.AAC.4